MYECDWWHMCKTDNTVKQHLHEIFPYKTPLREEGLLENIKSASLFGYVRSDNEKPENLREALANFPHISMNIKVGRDDIGPFTKGYAEKKGLLTQPRRKLISSYFLENAIIITPLLLFYLDLRLVCRKIYRFVQNNPIKCFNNFVQSEMNARREWDENPKNRVVAETMKLLVNSSYCYQIMDWSRHIVPKYLSDEKHMVPLITKCLNVWLI